MACTPGPGTEEEDSHRPLQTSQVQSGGALQLRPTRSLADTGRPSTERDLSKSVLAEPSRAPQLRSVCTLLFLFSRGEGERRRRPSSVVCRLGLRLWLWSADVLKYFLGTPSPELPVGINLFSKMKTVCAQTRGSMAAADPACHVRMVSSTCSTESAWQASFFSDLRLHSLSASRLATSRILETDCGGRGDSQSTALDRSETTQKTSPHAFLSYARNTGCRGRLRAQCGAHTGQHRPGSCPAWGPPGTPPAAHAGLENKGSVLQAQSLCRPDS